jgi:tetratricopeptide (TPR) repeat protein
MRFPCSKSLLFLPAVLSWLLACWFNVIPLKGIGSEQYREDSLHKALVKTTDIDKKVQIYLALAKLVKPRNTDSCALFLGEAQKLFWRINSFPYLGQTYKMKGDISVNENNFKEAIRQYNIAAFCFRKQGEKQKQMKLMNMIGNVYSNNDNIAEAFNYYLKAREVAEEIQDTEMLAMLDGNIGLIYIASADYQTGIDFYRKALSVFEISNDSLQKAKSYMNLSLAFNSILQFDSARIYADKATAIYIKRKEIYDLGKSYITHVYSLTSEKKYQEAVDYLDLTLKITRNHGSGPESFDSKFLRTDVYHFFGIIFFQKGDYQSAKKYLLMSYQLSNSLGFITKTKEEAEYLSLVYERTGKLDSSMYYFKKFKFISDSLNQLQSINVVKLGEVKMKYQADEKERQLQLTYAKSILKRNLAIFITTGVILLFMIIILFMRLRIKNQKEKQHKTEKIAADQLLESQNKELTLHVMSLIRKNEIILNISNRLFQIQEGITDEQASSEIIQLVNTMQKSMDGNIWEEFELRFKQVHSNFYEKLLGQFPDLTPSDLKLCALLKLNLSTKEICEMSGQRPATLDMARYRIRKKLGISNSQENLVTFLSQI